MSGQAAGMSISEAKTCLKQIQQGTNHSTTHGGKSAPKAGEGDNICSTPKHQK